MRAIPVTSLKSVPAGLFETLSWAVGTVAGVGHARVAPGTVASAVAAWLWYWMAPSVTVQWLLVIALLVGGTWAADRLARHLRRKDPSQVVVDEFVGMWLALLALPHHPMLVFVAFLMFRALDIAKTPPLQQLERLPGGWGIMADDVMAGVMTRVILAATLGWWIY